MTLMQVGIKADQDPAGAAADDSDGEYDYADLAAAMQESGDEGVLSDDDGDGSSDDDAFANKALAKKRGGRVSRQRVHFGFQPV